MKLASQQLLYRLKEEQPRVMVLDWYKDQRTRARVKARIEKILDSSLPESYDRNVFSRKACQVYDLIYDYSVREMKWTK